MVRQGKTTLFTYVALSRFKSFYFHLCRFKYTYGVGFKLIKATKKSLLLVYFLRMVEIRLGFRE